MNTEIIGIGSELLLGQIANTDAQYISQRLSELGINVYYHTVVGDNLERVKKVLKTATSRADLIFTTGGLGPTMDDLTKEAIADFLGLPMVLHESSKEAIEGYFKRSGREISENNYRQAYFPQGSLVMENNNGTAPGAIIEKDNKIFVVLPGPPRELIPMFNDFVMPYLEKKSSEKITSRVLKIYGMGESTMEDKIKDLLKNQTNPTIAPLSTPSELTLRITAKTSRDESPDYFLDPIEEEIKKRLGDVIYGHGEDSLESVVIDLLQKNKITIALAESCTGGLVSQRLTSIPGASKVFLEGITSYSNESKALRLAVDESILKEYGAVSSETAEEMALGLLKTSNADLTLSITGIAGPEGGSIEKPIGLVYIGIASKSGFLKVNKYNFTGNRHRIQVSASSVAIDTIRRYLLHLNII